LGFRISSLAAVVLAAGLLLPGPASAQYSTGPDFKPLTDTDGDVVFNHTADSGAEPRPLADACDDIHYPDLAVRAFRDKDGRVQLTLSHTSFGATGGTRRMFGFFGDLGTLTRDVCGNRVLTSHLQNDPATHNNDEWLAAPYTFDGKHVYALIYNEYQPWHDDREDVQEDRCIWVPDGQGDYVEVTNPPAARRGCHWSSITLGESTTMGDSYFHAPTNDPQNPAPHFVAGLPWPYTGYNSTPPLGNQSIGYADTSNVIKGPDGSFYAMFLARQYPKPPLTDPDPNGAEQKFGTCVMRTDNLADPSSWRAWDGDSTDDSVDGYTVQFVNPYPSANEPADKSQHVCAHVNHLFPDGEVQSNNPFGMSESLTYNRYLGKYMLVGSSSRNTAAESGHPPVPPDTVPVNSNSDVDFYYSLSSDMVNWSRKRLLLNVPHKFDGCQEGGLATLYSSVLDHQSTSRNFETTGKKFYVYFTRFNEGCGAGDDRDLVRVPVEFDIDPAGDKHATMEQGLTHEARGFDSISGTGFDLASGSQAYEGNNFAQATWISSAAPPPHGVLDVNWSRGDEVWYSAGFRIASSNFTDPSLGHAGASIMQWTADSGGGPVGIYLRTDGQWELRRNGNSIAGPFTLPEGSWFHLAMHQRLGQGSAQSPLNQVFVDGKLVAQTIADNMFTSTALLPRHVKFGLPVISGQPAMVYVDNAYVGRNQQASVGAPATPEIFSGAEQDTRTLLYWHASPGATEYRLYRVSPKGKLDLISPTPVTGLGWLDTGLINCQVYRYAIAAVDAQGRESVVSEPLELTPSAAAGCPPPQ
jgi:hypothetical protein